VASEPHLTEGLKTAFPFGLLAIPKPS